MYNVYTVYIYNVQKVSNIVVKLKNTRLTLLVPETGRGDAHRASGLCGARLTVKLLSPRWLSGNQKRSMKSCHVLQTTINNLSFECVNVTWDRWWAARRGNKLSAHVRSNKHTQGTGHFRTCSTGDTASHTGTHGDTRGHGRESLRTPDFYRDSLKKNDWSWTENVCSVSWWWSWRVLNEGICVWCGCKKQVIYKPPSP